MATVTITIVTDGGKSAERRVNVVEDLLTTASSDLRQDFATVKIERAFSEVYREVLGK